MIKKSKPKDNFRITVQLNFLDMAVTVGMRLFENYDEQPHRKNIIVKSQSFKTNMLKYYKTTDEQFDKYHAIMKNIMNYLSN